MIITDAMVEAAAKAAWADYTGLGSFEQFRDERGYFERDDEEALASFNHQLAEWPTNTGLFANADHFRSAARAALTAALGVEP